MVEKVTGARPRNKNTALIENADESRSPLFQTDEKTRVQRKNPHEFMHQSCRTSGRGTVMCGPFSPPAAHIWTLDKRGAVTRCHRIAGTSASQVHPREEGEGVFFVVVFLFQQGNTGAT